MKTKSVGKLTDKIFRLARSEGSVILYLFSWEEALCSSSSEQLFHLPTSSPTFTTPFTWPQSLNNKRRRKQSLIRKPWASCSSTESAPHQDQPDPSKIWWLSWPHHKPLTKPSNSSHTTEPLKCPQTKKRVSTVSSPQLTPRCSLTTLNHSSTSQTIDLSPNH